MTNRSPPEKAFLEEDTTWEETPTESPEDFQEDDPAAVRRPTTNKLIKTMHMEFNSFNRRRKDTIEQVLHAHQTGRRTFWEVYSGSGNLSSVMRDCDWDVMTFDYNTGWDFDVAAHRKEFLQLQDQVCPDFIWYSPKCTHWSPLQ